MKKLIRNYLRSGLLLASTLAALGQAARGDIVNFDDLPLGPNSHWSGPDPTGVDQPDPYGGPLPVKVGSFTSGGVKFGNEYNPNYDSWGGFAYSNDTDNTTVGYGNQFGVYAGSGNDPGGDNFGVAFGYVDNFSPSDPNQLDQLPYLEFPQTANPQSIYVTNMTYAATTMRDGNPFAKQFGGASGNDPDWFKLSIYGTDAQGSLVPGSVEFYLADYRFADNASDYILDSWAPVDLSALGSVTRLYFNLSSSDSGPFGMNTPSTFAIDDLQFILVPEPGTSVLAGLGLLALAWAGSRGRRPRHPAA